MTGFGPGSVYAFYGKRRVINVKKHAKMFALSAWTQIAVVLTILFNCFIWGSNGMFPPFFHAC